MADLGPARIGLSGVVTGALMTQAAEALGWGRERAVRLRDRRQNVILDVLRQGADIGEFAVNIASTMAEARRTAWREARPTPT